MNIREALKQNFREATGQAQEDEWKKCRESDGRIRKAIAAVIGGTKFDRARLDSRRR